MTELDRTEPAVGSRPVFSRPGSVVFEAKAKVAIYLSSSVEGSSRTTFSELN